MQCPMQSKSRQPQHSKPALQSAAGRPEPHPGASLRAKIQPPSSGVVREKQTAKKEKGREVKIHEPVRWTMRCRFNTEKDEMQTAQSKAMRDSE